MVALALTALVGALEVTPELPGTRGGTLHASPTIQPLSSADPLDSAAMERALVARFNHRPLARVLSGHTPDRVKAERIARALVQEARRLRVEPSLLAGVLLTENARLETTSVSSRGAIGLMQVMRFHAGEYECDSDDLLQVEANICHGARVFGHYLERTGDVHSALLRYNGCVRGRHTRNCKRYPAKVLRAAGAVRYELLKYR